MHTRSRRLAELRDEAAELERRLSDARQSLERELALTGQPGNGWALAVPGHPVAGAGTAGPGPEPGGYPPPEDPAACGQAGDDRGAGYDRAGYAQAGYGPPVPGPGTRPTGYSRAGYGSAGYGPAGYGPAGYGPAADEPDGYSPAAGEPAGHDPAADGPDGYSPAAGEPAGHDPAADGPDGYSPAAGEPAGHDPAADGPDGYSPAAGEPDGYSPAAGEPDGHGPEAGSPGDLLADERTEVLVSHGRSTAASHRVSRWLVAAIAGTAAAAAVTLAVVLLPGGGSSWPASVATVQREIAVACQNPDVKSEPSQVNFACNEGTSQVLWVFSLLTSGNNPRYRDPGTGRVGLEPISPAQGGQIAWSLNLHHPYDPSSPIDSLQVAARAINNIIGGATVTGPGGKPEIQPGLESDPENCLRYTGSAAVTARKGFPARCARPVVTPEGRAALVADVYQRWIVGAPAKAAQDAAVLFMNSGDPGNPQVQAILRHLPVRGG